MEAHKLRYIVGAILSEDGSEIDMAVQEKLTQNGYKIAKLPAVSYAVNTSFPYRSALSILIAVWRVYPRMNNYVKVRAGILLLWLYSSDFRINRLWNFDDGLFLFCTLLAFKILSSISLLIFKIQIPLFHFHFSISLSHSPSSSATLGL